MSEKKMTPARTGQSRMRVWDPFSRLAQLEPELERFFDMRWPRVWPRQFATTPAEFMPSVDMYEQDGDLITKVELPGVNKDDVDVTLEGGDLIIRGERKQESEVKEENYYRMERSYGSFYRRLPLPEGIQTDKISATYADGVLEVRMPKPAAAAPEPKKIAIK
jgi:HSP20 family protein